MISYSSNENLCSGERRTEKQFASSTGFITQKILADATVIFEWTKDYISQPHPDLGRSGSICPFVPPSLAKDTFYLALQYEIDGSCADTLKQVILQYSDVFLDYPPTDEKNYIYKAIVVAFPNIPDEQSTVLDVVHREVKDAFVRKGMMIGQFHRNCPEPAARNPFFKISTSPIPLVAMRYMSIHDILFLNECGEWFSEYQKRFGWKYEAGKVSEALYRELYYKTKELYSV
ncbi:MAG: hypothetical protein HY865_03690 [Chloroflexi bacterium]|nr:hypothetical protein [Chloroflexota bacterium]